MPARRVFTISEPRRIAFVGLGFTLGFGWFGSLRELWLAGALSGDLFSGQGASAFFATLAMALAAGLSGLFYTSAMSFLNCRSHPAICGLERVVHQLCCIIRPDVQRECPSRTCHTHPPGPCRTEAVFPIPGPGIRSRHLADDMTREQINFEMQCLWRPKGAAAPA